MSATTPGRPPAARKVINRKVRYESEQAVFKKEGHPFFPYAIFHDVVINLFVVVLIVVMAVIWHETAGPINEQHPTGENGWLGALYETKANPAVEQTEPRPEWYFLFLFELLRIFQTPWQLIFATIIIPTILMVLLIAWPFLDRGRDRRLSRRPIGTALGLATPVVLIALTIAGGQAPGAVAGTAISGDERFDGLEGATLISDSGCTSCHNFGGGGAQVGPGIEAISEDLDAVRTQIAQGGGGMPAYQGQLTDEQITTISEWIIGLKTGTPPQS